ncbi:hypothetical protein O9992_21705 [Vibrio lentus]|nr:hypothetical protein [Vibrio lentus]
MLHVYANDGTIVKLAIFRLPSPYPLVEHHKVAVRQAGRGYQETNVIELEHRDVGVYRPLVFQCRFCPSLVQSLMLPDTVRQ